MSHFPKLIVFIQFSSNISGPNYGTFFPLRLVCLFAKIAFYPISSQWQSKDSCRSQRNSLPRHILENRMNSYSYFSATPSSPARAASPLSPLPYSPPRKPTDPLRAHVDTVQKDARPLCANTPPPPRASTEGVFRVTKGVPAHGRGAFKCKRTVAQVSMGLVASIN